MRKYKICLGLSTLLLVMASLLLLVHPRIVQAEISIIPNGMTGSGSNLDPFQVTNCVDLQNVGLNPGFPHVLTEDIDCSDSVNWNSGKGFIPIGLNNDGTFKQTYNASFDGRGHTITDLYIDQSSNSSNYYGTGLFSRTSGEIYNFKVVNATIIGSQASVDTGGIIGRQESAAILSMLHFDGNIQLMCDSSQAYIGGLVGETGGQIINSSSSGGITLSDSCPGRSNVRAGGLAGVVGLGVSNAYSSMNITLDGSVDADPNVERFVGGLAGFLSVSASISNIYASGTLTITGNPDSPLGYGVGGLVGFANTSTSITNSFSATPIQLPTDCSSDCGSSRKTSGSLVGKTFSSGDYSTDYYDEGVTGKDVCDSEGATNCVAIDTIGDPDPNYFFNTSSQSPMSSWNFGSLWQTTPGLPTFVSFNPYPDAPTNFQATVGTTTTINVTWDPAVSGGDSSIYSYQFQCQKVGELKWFECGNEVTASSMQYDNVLHGLEASTQYNIQIKTRSSNHYYSDPATTVGVTAAPGFHLIHNCEELQATQGDLSGNYELANDVDCSSAVAPVDSSGIGFAPIGGCSLDDPSFTGVFEGNNYTISNLFSDQTDSGCSVALFGSTTHALLQDIRIASPVYLSNFIGAGLTAIDVGSSITNVHVTDATIEGSFVYAGGLVAGQLESTVSSRNEFTGTIAQSDVNGSGGGGAYIGGLYGFIQLYDSKSSSVSNNFADADISITNTTITGDGTGVYVGGLLGAGFTSQDADFTVTNSYSTGIYQQANSVFNLYIGGIVGTLAVNRSANITNSFSHFDTTGVPEFSGAKVGGILGSLDPQFSSETLPNVNSYFDADLASVPDCSGDLSTDCTAISSNTTYFYNNSTSPPLDQWDFDHIWQTTTTLPVFSAEAVAQITAIPEERLHPTVPAKGNNGGTPVVPAPTDTTTTPTYGPIAGGIVAETPAPIAKEGGFIGKIKELLRSIPAGVLVGFPYVAMGTLGLGALFLLVETIRQVKRLKEINLLIAKQIRIADERDTFWHLAANYLRAPITLLMGGVELLNTPAVAKSLGAAVAATAKISSKTGVENAQVGAITKLVTSMQAKVAGIMEQIEKSSSLQGITRPKLNTGQKVSRQLRFWIPLISVGALIILTNYVARGYRHLNVSTVSLITQLVIFLLVAMALYWILGALGLVQGKRKQAEALLAKQSVALDSARTSLISKTAQALDGDVAKLDGLLETLPKKEPALPIMREGSTRLRHMVDSFHLLISAQNNQLDHLSPRSAKSKLSAILDATLKDLEPEIVNKHLAIDRSDFGNVAVPGSRAVIDQVISSVLSNAVDFSPRGGKISISVLSIGDGTKVTISDNGPGISKEQLGRVFQPFNKADGQNGLQLDHGGLGIDLYLDRLIMDYLDGDIAVDSTIGEGTTLTITWPENQKSSGKLDLKSPDTTSPYLA